MINVCLNCGEYREDKRVDIEKLLAYCPLCNHPHPFQFLPLFIVCGPSGAGKTTLTNALIGKMDEVVVMDGDVLYGAVAEQINFWNVWLRMAKNINQSGRPLLLLSSGAIPPNLEPCPEYRYFSAVHYLALVEQDSVLTERLKARPAWRQSGNEVFIQEHLRFNHWLKEQASLPNPKIETLDTTVIDEETAVQHLKQWIRTKLELALNASTPQ
ncbi:MAG: nucleoside kinase [Chloroflexota bacterium]